MQPDVEARQQHRILQKEYGSFYRAVSDSLFRHNPMDLDGKRNTGEYDPEIDALLSRIREAEHLRFSAQDSDLLVFVQSFRRALTPAIRLHYGALPARAGKSRAAVGRWFEI